MRKVAKWLLDTLFPPHCVSCKTEGDFLCKNCVRSFRKKKIRARYPKWVKKEEFKYLDGVIYALDYAKNPQIKAAIEQFKYRFNQELVEYFGDLIEEKLDQLNMIKDKPIYFIPVPLHRKRLYHRGFNQAKIIAQEVMGRAPNAKVILPLLRVRDTKQQAKLNPFLRRRNMIGAFKLNKKFVQQGDFQKGIYFIVDDVCTTGSTLEQCAKILKENGLKKVYGLVVARAFK